MNLREGTRRLALLLGVGGFLFGGYVSYLELDSMLVQRSLHNKFEQLSASEVVQQERKTLQNMHTNRIQIDPKTGERITENHGPWEKYAQSNGEQNQAPDYASTWGTEIHKGGINTIIWNSDYTINSIETEDGQIHEPTPALSSWQYFFVLLVPIFGFFIPWGVIRAIGWVCAGFFQPAK